MVFAVDALFAEVLDRIYERPAQSEARLRQVEQVTEALRRESSQDPS